MTWQAVQCDVTKVLRGLNPKHIHVPDNLELDLYIEFQNTDNKRLSGDQKWIRQKADAKVLPLLESIKKKAKECDQTAERPGADVQDIARDLNAFVREQMETCGKGMADQIPKLFEAFANSQKAPDRIKSSPKITFKGLMVLPPPPSKPLPKVPGPKVTWKIRTFELHLAGASKNFPMKDAELDLTIQLDKALYDSLARDPTWIQKMRDKAEIVAKGCEVDIRSEAIRKDKKLAEGKKQEDLRKELDEFLRKALDDARHEMETVINKFIEEFKKGQWELAGFFAKTGVKAVAGAVGMGGAIATGVMSHGILVVPSALAAVKQLSGIVSEIMNVGSVIDANGTGIKLALKLHGTKILNLKNLKNVTEGGLNAISGALGTDWVPSVKKIGGLIEDHKKSIYLYQGLSHQASVLLDECLNAHEADLKKLHDEAAKRFPKDQLQQKLKEIDLRHNKLSEWSTDQLIKVTIAINGGVEKAEKNQEIFEKALVPLKEGLSKWTSYVDDVTSAVVDTTLTALGGVGPILPGVAVAKQVVAAVFAALGAGFNDLLKFCNK